MLTEHIEQLHASGISDKVRDGRGYESIVSKGELSQYGFRGRQLNVPTLLIPLYNIWGRNVSYMHRPDSPRVNPKKADQIVKYEYPSGIGNIIDAHPFLKEKDHLINPSIPLVIVEGTKKADAGLSHGLCTVSINGTNGWRHTNEFRGKVALPDFQDIALNERPVFLTFDSDSAYKHPVYQAESRLGDYLKSKGAIVQYIYMPEPLGVKVGLDDFLAVNDVKDLWNYAHESPIIVEYDTTLPINGYELSIGGNADRLIDAHRDDLLWSQHSRTWFFYANTHWEEDRTLKVEGLAQNIVKGMLSEAVSIVGNDDARKTLARHALSTDTGNKIAQMVHLAKSRQDGKLSSVPEQFDSHPWLFNVRNGVIDLQTGILRPHDSKDYITCIAPFDYDPAFTHPDLDLFLRLATSEDAELLRFIQKFFGYCLTGSTKEGSAIFIKGLTRRGKSTILQAIKTMMGTYAWKANFETFLARRNASGPRNDVANMAGKRLIVASEVSKAQRFNEALLKELISGEEINARQLYKEERQIAPGMKFAFTANDFPWLPYDDQAAWGRLNLISLDNPLLAEREYLPLKMWFKDSHESHTALLTWAVEGCLLYLEDDHLHPPKSVETATKAQQAEFDPLAEFFDNCIQLCPSVEGGKPIRTSFGDVWQAYNEFYAADKSTRRLGRKHFSEALLRRNIRLEKDSGNQYWCYDLQIVHGNI